MVKNGRRSLRLVVSAFALMLITTACSGGGNSPDASGEVDPNGVLRLVSPIPSRSLDPIRQTSVGEMAYTGLIYDRLIMVDTSDELVPGLASEWEFSEDGSYLELRLREGVHFHDGSPIDAEAVKANLERAKNDPDSSVIPALSDVTAVEVVDAQTVRLPLADGRGADVPGALSTNAGMIVNPAAFADPASIANGSPKATSGAYVVESYIPNEKTVLVAAEGEYWEEDAGRLGGLELINMPEASARLNAVRSGAADMSLVSSPADIAQAQQSVSSGEVEAVDVQYRSVIGLLLNTTSGDMADLTARQAVARAIDPEAISALFNGRCTPHRQFYPSGEWAAIPDWEYPYEYDVEEAKKLAVEAGTPSIDIAFGAGSNIEQATNVIQAQLSEADIDASITPLPVADSTPRWYAGDLQAFTNASVSPQTDPAGTVTQWLTSAYSLARAPQDHEAVIQLASEASDPTLSQADRASIYHEIWKMALEDVWMVPLCSVNALLVHSEKVMDAENIPWNNQGIQDLRYVAMSK